MIATIIKTKQGEILLRDITLHVSKNFLLKNKFNEKLKKKKKKLVMFGKLYKPKSFYLKG